jgi:GTPase Era involved in 16S rRNA processing
MSSRIPTVAVRAAARSASHRASGTVLRRPGADALKVSLPPVESPVRSRSLRCCLIGPTNAGKSTLLNALINRRVAAVSDKIHTTRVNTLGYLTDKETATQVEFLDAPGSLGPDVPALHREISEAISHAELALVVVDARDERSHSQVQRFLRRLSREMALQEEQEQRQQDEQQEQQEQREQQQREQQRREGGNAAELLAPGGGSGGVGVGVGMTDDLFGASGSGGVGSAAALPPRPSRRLQTALVLNKVDVVRPKAKLLKASRTLHGAFAFDWPTFMISAKTGDGVRDLRNWLLNYAKPGEWIVPAGTASVQPPLVRATEIIREQIFRYFYQELPYLIEQRNLAWTELDNPPGALRIDQQLLLPKKQKSTHALVQRRLPGIASAAREQLRHEFGRIVFLTLSVGTTGSEHFGGEGSKGLLSLADDTQGFQRGGR